MHQKVLPALSLRLVSAPSPSVRQYVGRRRRHEILQGPGDHGLQHGPRFGTVGSRESASASSSPKMRVARLIMLVVLPLLQGGTPQIIDYSDETGVYVEHSYEDGYQDMESPIEVSGTVKSDLSPQWSSPCFRAPKNKSFRPLNRSNKSTGSSCVISCHRWRGSGTARTRSRSTMDRLLARTHSLAVTSLMRRPSPPKVTSRARTVWRTPPGGGACALKMARTLPRLWGPMTGTRTTLVTR